MHTGNFMQKALGEIGMESSITPLLIKATGRDSRQFYQMDKYGFPRNFSKTQKFVCSFKTGMHFGKIAVRYSGNFCSSTATRKIDGVSYKYCKNIQRSDGYTYLLTKKRGAAFLFCHKE